MLFGNVTQRACELEERAEARDQVGGRCKSLSEEW